ncbi:MAG: serine/threonine protein kinase [Kofleriaceae bacterium]|nr:serine/threonine protein kinase [Kofleriaceae bacterium]
MLPVVQEEAVFPSIIGCVVGSYKIVSHIGYGGMGIVYEAEHLLMGKRAAVKVLRPSMLQEKEMTRRFEAEAKTTSMIRHPGIVEIFDYGFFRGGNPYITMELLAGESLEDRLARIGYLSVNDAINVTLHVADAMYEAHQHGIIHRDLKPGNVFLVPDTAVAGGERAKVLDFGVARRRTLDNSSNTLVGQIIGTPGYLSPEQAQGWLEIDQRSDVYALGCLFYKMLCGRTPFRGEGVRDVIKAHIHTTPAPVHMRDPSIPVAVSKIVSKLLEKNPRERYQRMSDLIASLRGVQESLFPPSPMGLLAVSYSNEKTEPMSSLTFLTVNQTPLPAAETPAVITPIFNLDEELLSEIVALPNPLKKEPSNQNVAQSPSSGRPRTAEPYQTLNLHSTYVLLPKVSDLFSRRNVLLAGALLLFGVLLISLSGRRDSSNSSQFVVPLVPTNGVSAAEHKNSSHDAPKIKVPSSPSRAEGQEPQAKAPLPVNSSTLFVPKKDVPALRNVHEVQVPKRRDTKPIQTRAIPRIVL